MNALIVCRITAPPQPPARQSISPGSLHECEAIMTCRFDFDPVNNILRYTWDGNLTDALFLEGDANGRKLLAASPPCRGILDFSRITRVDASSQTIQRTASNPSAYGPGQTVVLVGPEDVVYGLSRLFVAV